MPTDPPTPEKEELPLTTRQGPAVSDTDEQSVKTADSIPALGDPTKNDRKFWWEKGEKLNPDAIATQVKKEFSLSLPSSFELS
jgi:hypothetical protein